MHDRSEPMSTPNSQQHRSTRRARAAQHRRILATVAAIALPLAAAGQEPPFSINPGLNDAWGEDGAKQGFTFTVLPDQQLFFLAWYTFDTERPDESAEAVIGEPGHRWLTALGTWDGNVVTANVENTFGLTFNQALSQEDFTANHQDPDYGTITIEFHDCSSATLSYELPAVNRSGTIDIIRIVDDNVPLCESLAAGG